MSIVDAIIDFFSPPVNVTHPVEGDLDPKDSKDFFEPTDADGNPKEEEKKKDEDPPPDKPPEKKVPPVSPEGSPGTSRFTYVGANEIFPALGVKGEKSLHDWFGDPNEFIDAIFKGTEGDSGGTYKDECEDRGGTVPGVGPYCSNLKEKAQQDIARCFYLATIECIYTMQLEVLQTNLDMLNAQAFNFRERWRNFGTGLQALDHNRKEPEFIQLDPFRDEIKEFEKLYGECLEEIADLCECKRCIFTITTEEPEEEDVEYEDEKPDRPDKDPTGFDPPTRDDNKLSTTSGFGVIPRVWGRYVVAGNLIWISEKRQGIDTAHVDMHVGLCVGRVAALGRVWFDETLIYSGIHGIYSDLESAAATGGNTDDMSSSLGALTRVRLLNGGSAQRVSPLFAKSVGFGHAPAYRDLAVLEIQHVDLAAFGGKFPQIRVEVLTKIELTEVTNSSAAFSDLNNLWYDGRSQSVLAQDGDTLVTLTADLDVVGSHTDTGTFEIIEGGFPLVRSGISFLGQTAGILSPGVSPTLASRAELYVDGLIADNNSFYSYVDRDQGIIRAYYTDTREVLCLLRYDYSSDVAAFSPFLLEFYNEPFPHLGGSLIAYAGFTHNGDRYYDQYRVSGFNVNVGRHKLDRESPSGVVSIGVEDYENHIIESGGLWGGDSVGVAFRFLVHSKADNTFIFGFHTVAGLWVSKVSPHDLIVLWSVFLDGIDVTGGLNLVPSLGHSLGFVSDDSQAVTIDLISAEYSTRTITATRDAGTKQLYDPRGQRIFFIDTAGKVVSTTVDATSPRRVSLAEIVKSLVDPHFLYIDASALESITVDGYAATDGISAVTFLGEMKAFFQISYAESGGLLVFTIPGDTSSAIPVAPFSEVSRSRFTNNSRLDAITVSFVEINDTGMIASVQTVTDNIREGEALKELTYTLKINEDGETMRERAEKALVLARAQFNTVIFSTNWSNLAVNVGDRVTVLGSDYIIQKTSLSPDYTLTGVGRIATLEDSAETASVGRDTGRILSQRKDVPQSPYRPRIFFINSLSAEHAALSTSGKQIAYVGIESYQDDIAATNVVFRTPARTQRTPDEFLADYAASTITIPRSPRYVSREVTKSLHKGYVVDRPLHSGAATHTTFNPVDQLTVVFDKASSVEALRYMRRYTTNPHEVLELAGENTLVLNSELIKFASFSILNPTTVRFSNLFRGNRGTDPYIQNQLSVYSRAMVSSFLPDPPSGDGVEVYLYTPDTFVPIELNSYYTKVPTRGELVLTSQLAAGFVPLVYHAKTSAGSARAWAPTSVDVFETEEGSELYAIKLKRREPTVFPNLQNNIAPDTRRTREFLVQVVPFHFDITSFEDPFWGLYKEPQYSFYEQESDGGVLEGFSFNFERDPTRLLICGITRDGKGGYITGHPLIVEIQERDYPLLS